MSFVRLLSSKSQGDVRHTGAAACTISDLLEHPLLYKTQSLKIPTQRGNYLTLLPYQVRLTSCVLAETQLEAQHRQKEH